MSCECDGLCCCIVARPVFLRIEEGARQCKWKWVYCTEKWICGWKYLGTAATNCHDYASLSPVRYSQGPKLKDKPALLTTLYLLDAVLADHSVMAKLVCPQHWSSSSISSSFLNSLEEYCDILPLGGLMFQSLDLEMSKALCWQQWRMGISVGLLRRLGRGCIVCTDSCKFVSSSWGRYLMRESDWIIPTKILSRVARRGHYSIHVLTYYGVFPSLLSLCWGREKGGKSQTYQTLSLGRSHMKNLSFHEEKFYLNLTEDDGF